MLPRRHLCLSPNPGRRGVITQYTCVQNFIAKNKQKSRNVSEVNFLSLGKHYLYTSLWHSFHSSMKCFIANCIPSLPNTVCFACKTSDLRKHFLIVLLTPSQICARANADIGNCSNSFANLDSSTETSVLVFTSCCCKKTGWGATCNSKRTGTHDIFKYLRPWKTRLRGSRRHSGPGCCIVCSSQKQNPVPNSVAFGRSRAPTCDWTLFNLLMGTNCMREAFRTEFCRLSMALMDVADTLIRNPSESFLCPTHLNHGTYAQKSAFAHGGREMGLLDSASLSTLVAADLGRDCVHCLHLRSTASDWMTLNSCCS